MRLAAFAPALALMLAHFSNQPAAAREYARVVLLRPRLGMEAQFEAGYKRWREGLTGWEPNLWQPGQANR